MKGVLPNLQDGAEDNMIITAERDMKQNFRGDKVINVGFK